MLSELKNQIDFYIRNKVTFTSRVNDNCSHLQKNKILQNEIKDFINLLELKKLFSNLANKIKVVDVGAKDFFCAPVLNELFFDKELTLSGYEVDAFRRYANLKTRFDYGKYYCSQYKNTFYFAQDYLASTEKVDICFLLNPFVFKKSALLWGLPTRFSKIEILIHKIAESIKSQGYIVLSNPTNEEFTICEQLIFGEGLTAVTPKVNWMPKENSLQQKMRVGRVYIKNYVASDNKNENMEI